MILLNIRTESILPSGFEMSVCKMQKDPRNYAGLARSTKFVYCYADLVHQFLYLYCLFAWYTWSIVYSCSVFAQIA